MPEIIATEPVVTPAEASVTYDKWFLTKMVSNVSPDRGTIIVNLRRSAIVDGKTVLMPKSDNSDVSFNVDLYSEIPNTPELAAAMEAVLTAVVAYGTKKKLL